MFGKRRSGYEDSAGEKDESCFMHRLEAFLYPRFATRV